MLMWVSSCSSILDFFTVEWNMFLFYFSSNKVTYNSLKWRSIMNSIPQVKENTQLECVTYKRRHKSRTNKLKKEFNQNH